MDSVKSIYFCQKLLEGGNLLIKVGVSFDWRRVVSAGGGSAFAGDHHFQGGGGTLTRANLHPLIWRVCLF